MITILFHTSISHSFSWLIDIPSMDVYYILFVYNLKVSSTNTRINTFSDSVPRFSQVNLYLRVRVDIYCSFKNLFFLSQKMWLYVVGCIMLECTDYFKKFVDNRLKSCIYFGVKKFWNLCSGFSIICMFLNIFKMLHTHVFWKFLHSNESVLFKKKIFSLIFVLRDTEI